LYLTFPEEPCSLILGEGDERTGFLGMKLWGLITILVLALMMGGARAEAENEPSIADSPSSVSWNDFDQAVRLYVAGHYEEAIGLCERVYRLKLTERQNQLVRFLSGLAAFKTGRFQEVEGFLAGPGRVPPALIPYALYISGQACFYLDEDQKARSLLADFLALLPDAPQAHQARLTRAWALFHLGRPEQAAAEFRALHKKEENGEVRLSLARIHESLGQIEQARENYRLAMENSNTGEVRAEATWKYKELMGLLLEKPGREDQKLTMVRLLRREWRLDETLELIDRLLAQGGGSDYLGTLRSEKARVLFFSGRIDQALPYYQGAAGPERAKKDPYGAWMYARCLKRLGRWAEAADAFLVAAEAAPSTGRADQGRLEAGIIYLRLGEKTKAQECWSKIRPGVRDGRLKDELFWHTGFFYYRHQAWDQAAERFLAITRECPRSPLARGAEYWLARSLERGGHQAKAAQRYRRLAARDDDFYYRSLALQRVAAGRVLDQWSDRAAFKNLLKLDLPHLDYSFLPLRFHKTLAAGRSAWAAADFGPDLGDLWAERALIQQVGGGPLWSNGLNEGVARIKDLAAAGVMDLAAQEAEYWLDSIGSKNIYRWSAKPAARMTGTERRSFEASLDDLKIRLFGLVSAYQAEVGDYHGFVRRQYRHYRLLVSGPSEEEKLNAARRFHPLAYPGAVLGASEEYDLHPALILAVIRIESFYNPLIISPANARGLMQILPTTGQKIAARLNLAPPAPDALFDPETNIRLGCWYLAGLIREFDGQLPLAIASYNGGPFNVKRWVSQADQDVSLEEFVETIPFDQTREYVKKVLGTFYLYRYLFGGQNVGLDLTIPLRKTCLDQIDF